MSIAAGAGYYRENSEDKTIPRPSDAGTRLKAACEPSSLNLIRFRPDNPKCFRRL